MLMDAVGRVNDSNLVDRRIITRLLLTYLEDGKATRVLELLATTLRLTKEEKDRVRRFHLCVYHF